MFSFVLNPDFIASYADRPVPWGFKDAGGNSFGELVFIDKYSRLKDDGTKERWHEVCERVINGMYSIQKDHAKTNRLPWSDAKAQASAREAYDRMFTMKWTPPGRGLWMMGTPLVMVHRNSAALQNCAFVSTADMTKNDPAGPFAFLMEASMLGVGVGFDTLGADKGFQVYEPGPFAEERAYVIPDTREGWVHSVRLLLESYLKPNMDWHWAFDYSEIRPAGALIKTFGGTAAGPAPLKRLHDYIRSHFDCRSGTMLTSEDIVDLCNMLGQCVVAGNVRRSAELALGSEGDKAFLELKNATVNRRRMHWCSEDWACDYEAQGMECPGPGWGGLSNNSVNVSVGSDYTPYVEGIARNGEPGLIWMDVSRAYGRLVDPPNSIDRRAMGYNPCAEQTLESFEMCTLVETYISRHDSLEDFKRTLKFAYLYAKTVTLLPTHWERTNAIMQRNRRIGCSLSGLAEFADARGLHELRTWMESGYQTVCRYDKVYSEWLCIRESIKKTSIKPSGTVSFLAGVTPGAHWGPGGHRFMRALRLSKTNPLLPLITVAGYRIEDDVTDPANTVVVYFPIESTAARSEQAVTMWEKANLAIYAQRYWADNSVSVTVTFDSEHEADSIGALLHMVEGQLKTISFLKLEKNSYPQMPYTDITREEYDDWSMRLMRVPTDVLYEGGRDAIGEAYCTTDKCEVPG